MIIASTPVNWIGVVFSAAQNQVSSIVRERVFITSQLGIKSCASRFRQRNSRVRPNEVNLESARGGARYRSQ